LRKRAKSTKAIEERRIEEQLKHEQEYIEKEKMLESRAAQKEQNRREIKESIERKSQIIYTKNYKRKEEQEKKLFSINKRLENMRRSQVERIKGAETVNRSKQEINMIKLRSQIENELRGLKDSPIQEFL
jgi:hypothetical protein